MIEQESSGWTRSAGLSVLTLGLLVLAFFYVPHWILSELSRPSRGVRVWIATAWTAGAFALACYAAWRSSVAKPSLPDQ